MQSIDEPGGVKLSGRTQYRMVKGRGRAYKEGAMNREDNHPCF